MLPLNFHKTFIPERRLIASLLAFAEKDGEGNFQEISVDTGIPMGKSTGKVPAILDYANGMGLVSIEKKTAGVRKPILTPFGKIVNNEDRFLSEEITQWLVHMNLCRGDIGARAWHEIFAKGRNVLGTSFTKSQLEDFLVNTFGAGKDRIGPMLLMYADNSSFSKADAISINNKDLIRKKAPITDIFSLAYSAYILSLLETYFPGDNQVTITEFNEKTLWFDICLWNQSNIEYLLRMVESKGFVSVDRQMQPWIIEKMAASSEVWPTIYNELA